jgi:4-hydroxy 2-oxovalerate aldolase
MSMGVKLLDCTLRDGGYVNNWEFSENEITSSISNLTSAGIDYIEIGYLNSAFDKINGSQFQSVETASKCLPNPEDRKGVKYIIMADVAQFDAESLCRRNRQTIDGIRVVFYKRQIEQAFAFCEKVAQNGYDLFLQPMVTIDYSPPEFQALVRRFSDTYKLYAVSVVDSFGCMGKDELFGFIHILESGLESETGIGFHGHDNMQYALSNAMSLFEYNTKRELVIDSSICGIGRGAGNLNTELIANFYNERYDGRYLLNYILNVMSDVVEPLFGKYIWGYSPYLYITALRKCHPNFAAYLLEKHTPTVNEFYEFLSILPDDMRTKCTRPYVESLWNEFQEQKSKS